MNALKQITVAILTGEARMVLRKYKPHIVAITGSVGKTSTKDAVFSVLEKRFFVRKSDKSFNSELGLPLTVLGLPNAWKNPLGWLMNIIDGLVLILARGRYPEWLVLEVGADRPGDIRRAASWLPVDIAIITRLPDVPVHVEYFDSPEQVAEEKAELLKALKPGGYFLANADDAKVVELASRVGGRPVKTYGFSEGATVKACTPAILYEKGEEGWPIGISADVDCRGAKIPLSIMGTIGAHSFLPLLAAFAVGEILGMEPAAMAEALAGHTPPPGRMRLIPGLKESLLIDDTYNASPVATLAALDALSVVTSARRKVAVLGDMMELGRFSVEKHREVGKRAAEVCDLLLTVGFRARDIADAARSAGLTDNQVLQFEDAQKAGKELEFLLAPGDCVLIKGSQSMRMERAVEEVMAHPEHAATLLVRQDAEWKRR